MTFADKLSSKNKDSCASTIMNDDTVCQWITDKVCSGLVLFIHKTEERRDSASEHPAL